MKSTLFFAFHSLVAQRIKHLPAMWEARVQSLGWEDPLEKEVATHSSILAWRIPWTEEPGRLQSTSRKELDTTERLHFHFNQMNRFPSILFAESNTWLENPCLEFSFK